MHANLYGYNPTLIFQQSCVKVMKLLLGCWPGYQGNFIQVASWYSYVAIYRGILVYQVSDHCYYI